MQEWRESKDAAFRSTEPDASPLLPADRQMFQGLAYFPIDPSYHVPASLTLERTDPPVIVELQTTGAQRDRYRRVGTLEFTLGGATHRLTAFALESGPLTRLFVPFGDLTNGSGTYKGGRYLELDQTATGLYDLDFNRAYHPFCVYDPSYICPVPPRENHLVVAIKAGEMLPPSYKAPLDR